MAAGIRVLIVDDSAVVRQTLKEVLESDPGIEVMAVASDPIFALKRMESSRPDVIITDVEMPRMDGITFLRTIMERDPIPVVVCSSKTEEDQETPFGPWSTEPSRSSKSPKWEPSSFSRNPECGYATP